MTINLVVERANLHHLAREERPAPALGPNQARLQVGLFALTANNITYGAFGDMLGYWNFFPAGEGFGRIPVWGFASVAETTDSRLSVGERVYGYLPMSTDFVIDVGEVKPHFFSDAATNRAGLSPFYNQYMRQSVDPAYAPEKEAITAVLRPLFTTGFLLDQHVASHPAWGVTQVIITSASSKTSLSMAACSKARGAEKVVGLTSSGNAAFVRQTGFYDQVVTYDDLAAMERAPAVLVDMAGNPTVVRRVHELLEGVLAQSVMVGGTHWEVPRGGAATPLPGPQPALFFAPDVIQNRIAQWGPAGFQERLNAAWTSFTVDAPRWLAIQRLDTWDAVEAAYRDLAAGKIGPAVGLVATPR